MSRQRGTYRTGYGQPGRPDQKRADPLTPPELADLIDRIAAEKDETAA